MTKPNPGSLAAEQAGCCCPVLDNNHGRQPPRPPDQWWINADCKLHGIDADPPSYTCRRCGRASYHPKDIETSYCGNCHLFDSDEPDEGAGAA